MNTEWKDAEELDASGIKRCDELSNFLFALQGQIDEHEEKAKGLREEADGIKSELERILNHFGKPNWKTNNGSIEVRTRTSVRTPKTPEEKKALFEWLQGKNIFWELAGVNSQSLNSLYKTELEIAENEGKSFSMPGVGEPTITKQIIAKPKR